MAGFGAAPQSGEMAAQIQQRMALQQRMKSGASWFYWIAGLSVINSVIILSGSNWHFLAGLGITDIISAMAEKFGSAGTVIAVIADALVTAVFVLFGVFANKRQTWAFVVGMTFYGLDGVLVALMGFWLGLAFHGYVLFLIFKGMQAGNELNEFEANMPPTIVATP